VSRTAAQRPLSLILVLVLLTFVAWPNLFLKGQAPIDGNVLRLFYPNWVFLHAHPPGLFDWPLWNPSRDMGEPFLADPQSLAAYPPMWVLCRLAGFETFVRLWILGHTLLVGFFMRKWMLQLTNDAAAAAAATVVIAFNGYFVAHGTLLNHFAAAAYVPAILYFFGSGSWIGLGVSLALQWMAGFPPFSLLTGVALAAWTLFAGSTRSALFSRLWKGGAIAIGLSAFQLIPFLELIVHSARPIVLGATTATEFSEPLGQLVRMIVVPQWAAWSRAVIGDQAVVAFYAGPVVMAAVIWAVLRGGRTERLLAIGAVVCAALSLGAEFPGYSLLIPLHLFRFPANWLLLGTTALAVLCGFGIARVSSSKWQWIGVSAIVVDLLVFAQYGRTPWFAQSFLDEPPPLARSLIPLSAMTRVYHSPVLIQALGEQESKSLNDWLFFRNALVPSFGTAFGLNEVSSYQVLKLARAARFQDRLTTSEPSSPLWRWAGVGTVVTGTPAGASGPQRIEVISRTDVDPPVFFAAESSAQRTAVSTSRPGLLEADATTDRADTLVFSQVFYPGWRVTVDGQRQTLSTFEDTFLSVGVPPGEHHVLFAYSPMTFWIGAAVSLSALAFMLTWATISQRLARAIATRRKI
jgi:hypothetical protein